jgi:hypothetical protein
MGRRTCKGGDSWETNANNKSGPGLSTAMACLAKKVFNHGHAFMLATKSRNSNTQNLCLGAI